MSDWKFGDRCFISNGGSVLQLLLRDERMGELAAEHLLNEAGIFIGYEPGHPYMAFVLVDDPDLSKGDGIREVPIKRLYRLDGIQIIALKDWEA